uniref:Uncharacterized protein n=1 Tax=Salix viminalis TaxID=40686 RepID=A0A6N2MFL4_SALVM
MLCFEEIISCQVESCQMPMVAGISKFESSVSDVKARKQFSLIYVVKRLRVSPTTGRISL